MHTWMVIAALFILSIQPNVYQLINVQNHHGRSIRRKKEKKRTMNTQKNMNGSQKHYAQDRLNQRLFRKWKKTDRCKTMMMAKERGFSAWQNDSLGWCKCSIFLVVVVIWTYMFFKVHHTVHQNRWNLLYTIS